jgi:tetratricopeptide (TPR) repeat protein
VILTSRLGRLAVLGLAVAGGACAAPGSHVPRPEAPARAAVVPASVAALATARRQAAEALEREGKLRRALDEWRIALTVDPGDATARARKRALEGRIEREAADRLRQGREALGRGAHLEARRQFLAVLALDPANRAAFEALRFEVKEVRVVAHTVRRGETLTLLAERYYGDRSRGEVIAETNQLPLEARLNPGAAVRIPEIPGVPFQPPEGSLQPVPEPSEVNPLLGEAREALERGDFQSALVDVDRVLGPSPQHAEGLELKKAILYGLGRSHVRTRQWDEAYQALTQLARLGPAYQDAPVLLRQARDRLVEQHYNQGLRLFREEKLEQAITAWRTVLELDPDHASARRNVEQAERLLKSLQQRQRATPPGPAK